ncbi:glycosyltransferase [Chiayiivirga flava]|uniref:Glycosyltransferase involved in cell wall biosynthesis n=1 Tax=Chiayiivirga flava TaxID=659595 RepID=A0A7W8D771_9GAMM|nr:glycosyltransferase [Chiayiivirga flava]MBB5209173.1 glycosyltransferase involved in cell wall biosynthesis [Chiayiivirga flava]
MNRADRMLRWLSEHAELALVKALLVFLQRVPWIGPVVAFRMGDLHGALRGLRRWPNTRLAWQEQLRDKIDAMLVDSPTSVGQAPRAFARAPQRILYVVDVAPNVSRSGYALRTAALTEALRATGLQVQIVARFSSEPDMASAVPASVFEPERAAIERHAAALVRIIERERIDVVHAASPYANAHATNLAAARCGIASVYEMRGLWHRTRAAREPMYGESAHYAHGERQELRACMEASLAIALSTPMQAWMVAGGVPAASTVVIGNAANTARPHAMRPPRDARTVTLGYAGALERYEGLDRLLPLFANHALCEAQLLIAGDGAERKALHRQATRLGLGSRVHFLGTLPPEQLEGFYARLDAIVLPRIDSAMTRMVPPLKPFDALAHGVPVLMSVAVAEAVGDVLRRRDDVSVFADVAEVPSLLPELQRSALWVPPPDWRLRARELLDAYGCLSWR